MDLITGEIKATIDSGYMPRIKEINISTNSGNVIVRGASFTFSNSDGKGPKNTLITGQKV